MIELDGVQFTVKTAAENTQDMLTTINDYCSSNNILNSKGEVVQLEENFASPLYVILWALGYLVTVVQKLVYSVGQAHNVQASSPNQLLNIADMANVKRRKASKTTITVIIRAATEGDANYDNNVNEGNCVVTSTDTISYNGVTYTPAVYPSRTIKSKDYAAITFVASEAGAYSVSAGSIQDFDSSVANVGSFEQLEAIPGQEEESISSLRERIQRKQYSGTSIEECENAIMALEGITSASITFNYRPLQAMLVGHDDISIPPRCAMVVVQGYSPDIAKTFYRYLSLPSVLPNTFEDDEDGTWAAQISDNLSDTRTTQVQYYTTHSGQLLPVAIVNPYLALCEVNVYVGSPIEGSIEKAIKDAVAKTGTTLIVGQNVTSSMILQALTDFSSYGILGALVRESGSTLAHGYTTYAASDTLYYFSTESIVVVMPEVS